MGRGRAAARLLLSFGLYGPLRLVGLPRPALGGHVGQLEDGQLPLAGAPRGAPAVRPLAAGAALGNPAVGAGARALPRPQRGHRGGQHALRPAAAAAGRVRAARAHLAPLLHPRERRAHLGGAGAHHRRCRHRAAAGGDAVVARRRHRDAALPALGHPPHAGGLPRPVGGAAAGVLAAGAGGALGAPRPGLAVSGARRARGRADGLFRGRRAPGVRACGSSSPRP